jgi:hypothetical protein
LLATWDPKQGLVETAVRADEIKPARVWNDILVGTKLHYPRPVFVPLKKAQVELARKCEVASSDDGVDLWMIDGRPVVVSNVEHPSQFYFDPPGPFNIYWGPEGVSYWSYGVEIP